MANIHQFIRWIKHKKSKQSAASGRGCQPAVSDESVIRNDLSRAVVVLTELPPCPGHPRTSLRLPPVPKHPGTPPPDVTRVDTPSTLCGSDYDDIAPYAITCSRDVDSAEKPGSEGSTKPCSEASTEEQTSGSGVNLDNLDFDQAKAFGQYLVVPMKNGLTTHEQQTSPPIVRCTKKGASFSTRTSQTQQACECGECVVNRRPVCRRQLSADTQPACKRQLSADTQPVCRRQLSADTQPVCRRQLSVDTQPTYIGGKAVPGSEQGDSGIYSSTDSSLYPFRSPDKRSGCACSRPRTIYIPSQNNDDTSLRYLDLAGVERLAASCVCAKTEQPKHSSNTDLNLTIRHTSESRTVLPDIGAIPREVWDGSSLERESVLSSRSRPTKKSHRHSSRSCRRSSPESVVEAGSEGSLYAASSSEASRELQLFHKRQCSLSDTSNCTVSEYDISSDLSYSAADEEGDYGLFLSKVKTNLRLGEGVQKIIRESETSDCDSDSLSLTSVTSLSENSNGFHRKYNTRNPVSTRYVEGRKAGAHRTPHHKSQKNVSWKKPLNHRPCHKQSKMSDHDRTMLEYYKLPELYVDSCSIQSSSDSSTTYSSSDYTDRLSCRAMTNRPCSGTERLQRQLYSSGLSGAGMYHNSASSTSSSSSGTSQPRQSLRGNNRLLGDLMKRNNDRQLLVLF